MTAIEPILSRPIHRLSTARAYESAVAAVIARMRERPGEPLNLAEMAQMAGVSRCHFDRVFRTVTGLSPRVFQTAVRLQSASRLLLTTTFSVTDICFDVGYESLGSFVTKFTQTFGISPQKLREVAAGLDRPWSEWPVLDVLRCFERPAARPTVVGKISVPGPAFDGLIFVGLFAEPLPMSEPRACCVLTTPGRFSIGAVPPGEHYLLAVAMSWRDRPLDFLLNENALRGAAVGAVSARRKPVPITLRPACSTDPPINLALPFLLVQKIVGSGATSTLKQALRSSE